MLESVRRMDLFPTQVYVSSVGEPEGLNAALLGAIAAERSRDGDGVERSNFSGLGGWHSRTDLHRDAAFAPLAERVRAAAAHLAQDLGYAARASLEIGAMWAIVNPPGATNQAHVHPGALWSGVYYVAAREDAGDIELTDPRTANLMQQPAYDKRPLSCSTFVRIAPVPGRLLLFPGWLYHSVHPNLSKDDRVIVSFNLAVA